MRSHIELMSPPGSSSRRFDDLAARIGVGGDSGQRLVDLVCNAGGKFTENNQAVGMQQLFFQLPNLLLGGADLAQVLDDTDIMVAARLFDLAY